MVIPEEPKKKFRHTLELSLTVILSIFLLFSVVSGVRELCVRYYLIVTYLSNLAWAFIAEGI